MLKLDIFSLVLGILKKPAMLENLKPFFITFTGNHVEQSTPYLMQLFLRSCGLKNKKITCNGVIFKTKYCTSIQFLFNFVQFRLQVRHTTAQLQFDEYVEKMLSGGPNADVALLGQHGVTIQVSICHYHSKYPSPLPLYLGPRLYRRRSYESTERIHLST